MPKTKRKTARKPQGRPTGSKNREPRVKRQLTPVQKLREHILIELGVDKKDIAAAIGTTHQTVSNVFFDEHRSIYEADIARYLNELYLASPVDRYDLIDDLIDRLSPQPEEERVHGLTPEKLGWPKRALEITP